MPRFFGTVQHRNEEAASKYAGSEMATDKAPTKNYAPTTEAPINNEAPIIEAPINNDVPTSPSIASEAAAFQYAKTTPTHADIACSEVPHYNDLINDINKDMARLGWTKQDGIAYLIKTYGKKSRQLLSDYELIEFWQYCQRAVKPINFKPIESEQLSLPIDIFNQQQQQRGFMDYELDIG